MLGNFIDFALIACKACIRAMKLTRLLPQTGLPADQLQVPWNHLMQAHVALLQPSVEVLIMAPMIICLVATDVY